MDMDERDEANLSVSEWSEFRNALDMVEREKAASLEIPSSGC
jgi:hypothetical protein